MNRSPVISCGSVALAGVLAIAVGAPAATRGTTELRDPYGRHFRNFEVFEERFRETAISKVKLPGEKETKK